MNRRRYIMRVRARNRRYRRCIARWMAHPEEGLRWS